MTMCTDVSLHLPSCSNRQVFLQPQSPRNNHRFCRPQRYWPKRNRPLNFLSFAQSPDSGAENMWLPQSRLKSAGLQPSYFLTREQALEAQLKALKANNFPINDHGIEVLYRFAGIDPWSRSTYFGGRSLDLGQFERFRRIWYTKCYITLVNHSEHDLISSLEVSEDLWKARVHVENEYRKEEATYEFTFQRQLGGLKDGAWYCTQLRCDGCDDKHIYGVI